MGNIGLSELLVIFLLLSLVFGASRLPALGESLGKTVRSFKRGLAQDEDIEVSQAERKQVPPPEQVPLQQVPPQSSAQQAPSSATQGQVSDAEIVEEHKR